MIGLLIGLIAQSLVPAPADFQIRGSLDLVAPAIGFVLEHDQPVILSGWNAECRSGLQPVTQRIGMVGVTFMRASIPQHEGEIFSSELVRVYTPAREDVAQALMGDCPAIGPNVGFTFLTRLPPFVGDWTLTILVSTTDGAGRLIYWRESKQITVY